MTYVKPTSLGKPIQIDSQPSQEAIKIAQDAQKQSSDNADAIANIADILKNVPTNAALGALSELQTEDRSSFVNAVNENVKKVGVVSNSQGVSLESFSVQIPEVDDSGRFTRALNSLSSNGGVIVIPQGKTYTGNMTVSKSNVVITGGGTLKGCINLYGTDMSGMDRFSGTGNVLIENIIIDGERLRNGINNKWFFGVTITNVTFKNCLKTVYFEQIPKGQHCSRYTITNNHLIDCQYGLYVDYVTPTAGELAFVVGDITFSNNMYESRSNTAGRGNVYHIWAKGLDGLICKGNTLFFAHTGDEQGNIYLDTFNWAIIEGNNLFEPKTNAIRALNGSNLVIANNNVAWSGAQAVYVTNITNGSVNGNTISFKDDSSVITNRTGIYVENSPFFVGTINDNKIYFPNEYAIQIKDSSNITISGNISRNKYSVNEPVKIDTLSSCSSINIVGNTFTAFAKTMQNVLSAKPVSALIHFSGNAEDNAGTILNGVYSPTFKSYSGNQASIDISNSSLIVFANIVPTTITSITTENLSTAFPRTVTMYSYNGNTSLSTSIPNTSLKTAPNGVSVTIPAGESITFLVYGGAIKELSRSFSLENRVRTISDTSTTADVTSYDQINFNQPSAATFTNLAGTFTDGKMMDMIAFNGNTTIANTVANLKGAVNVTIPNKGLLRLKYTSGNWYEVARNF